MKRPENLEDFDLTFGFRYLVERRSSPDLSVWSTNWLVNIACGAVALILAGGGIMALRFGLTPDEPRTMSWLVSGFFAVIYIVGLVAMTVGALSHGKLVVDSKRRELRAYRGIAFRNRQILRFDSIRQIERTRISVRDFPSADHSIEGTTHDVLIAELHDDRLAMLAIDAPAALHDAIVSSAK